MSNLSYEKVAWPETPNDWEIICLRELISKKRESFDDTDFERLPVKSINNEKGFIDSEEQFDKQVFSDELGNYSVVRPEEFAYNPARINVGSIAYQNLEEPVLISPMYEVFSVDQERLNTEYFRQFISTEKAVSLFSSFSQGSIRKNLKFNLMGDIPFALPPLSEQRKISEFLSILDQAIHQTDEIIETSKQLKKGLMQDLITKGIDHENFRDVYIGPRKVKIPNSWEDVQISDLIESGSIEKIKDGNHGNLHPTSDDFVQEGIPFLTSDMVQNRRIKWEECKRINKETADELKKGKSKSGDLLLTHKGSVGRVNIIPENKDLVVLSPQVTYYRTSEDISTEYLAHLFRSKPFQHQLEARSKQSTRDYIGLTKQKNLKVFLPPLNEQREIAERLSVIDEKIREEEEYKEKLEELKKGLMQDLLTGKVRVESD